MHPLAVAHVPDAAKPGTTEDIWIDADVPGPPLPAGRISPELRGRSALYGDGHIAPLPATNTRATQRDEIDVRLVVDEQGNAKGVLTVLLRGRSAQDIAEALVRLVGNERQRALRGIALAWVPFATVEKVELSSTEGSWQVAIRAELTRAGVRAGRGNEARLTLWVLPGDRSGPLRLPASVSSTTLSVDVREPGRARERARDQPRDAVPRAPARRATGQGAIARLAGPVRRQGAAPVCAARRSRSPAPRSRRTSPST